VGRNEKVIVRYIERYDGELWWEEVMKRSTLHLYAAHKRDFEGKKIYDNTFESSLLFRARSNSLKLAGGKDLRGCQLCPSGELCSIFLFSARVCCGFRSSTKWSRALWRRCCCLFWGCLVIDAGVMWEQYGRKGIGL
jgi:hypothetical protein